MIVLFGLLAVLFLMMTLTAFIKLSPPASVLMVMLRMPYQYAVNYFTPVLAIGLLVFLGFKFFKGTLPSSSEWILAGVFTFVLIGGVIYQFRIMTVKAQKQGMNYREVASDQSYESDTEDVSEDAKMQQLFVTTPRKSSLSKVCVVYVNYGGWKRQDVSAGNGVRDMSVSQGYSFAQLAGMDAGDGDIIDTVNDVNRGVAWLKDRFQYEQIFLIGGSAGATIALLCAFAAGDEVYDVPKVTVDGVIALYPISSPKGAYEYFVLENPASNVFDYLGDKLYCNTFKGKTGSLAGETKVSMAPFFGEYDTQNHYGHTEIKQLIGNQDIPILMIQGELDSMVVMEDNRDLFQSLIKRQKTIAYLELPGVDHAFDSVRKSIPNKRAQKEMISWLNHLVAPNADKKYYE